ncbi:hypothetical protein BN137_530 [Cronobacter condimenti 1330]|uniref:Uncharacterized protein n=1 Tax=Cronobacter condimenti 1330 TaxID=1073999 RepID=K7ZXR8_9ENTR|nr:hypothetical protein BN137_530 [Cronobacter condimenti 1330]
MSSVRMKGENVSRGKVMGNGDGNDHKVREYWLSNSSGNRVKRL